MKKLIAALLLLATPAVAASPSNWAIVCTATCTAPDGTSQPAGTMIGKIWWDGVTAWTPPPNTNAVAFTGQTLYAAASNVTVISGAQLWQRFTPAEQAALLAYSSGTFAATAISLATSVAISSQDPVIIADFATMVADNIITSARSTKILNFNQSSP